MKQQTGQVLIVLLLLMLVALTIGLAVTQRSLTDITTSTQTEQATRAYSAAEAGIEKAIQLCPSGLNCSLSAADRSISFQSQAATDIEITDNLPRPTQALEFPQIRREDFAHFWLANPQNLGAYYTNPSFDIYFGNEDIKNTTVDNRKPALEVNVVTLNAGNYTVYKYFYDSETGRMASNQFSNANCPNAGGGNSLVTANLDDVSPSLFFCRATVPPSPCSAGNNCTPYVGTPILVRVRLLYSDIAQKVALAPTGGQSLPYQAAIYSSTGNAGLSQKRLRVFRMSSVAPALFDFAIFSEAELSKN